MTSTIHIFINLFLCLSKDKMQAEKLSTIYNSKRIKNYNPKNAEISETFDSHAGKEPSRM